MDYKVGAELISIQSLAEFGIHESVGTVYIYADQSDRGFFSHETVIYVASNPLLRYGLWGPVEHYLIPYADLTDLEKVIYNVK